MSRIRTLVLLLASALLAAAGCTSGAQTQWQALNTTHVVYPEPFASARPMLATP